MTRQIADKIALTSPLRDTDHDRHARYCHPKRASGWHLFSHNNKEENKLPKPLLKTAILVAVCLSASTGLCDTRKGAKIDGKKEFGRHCAKCHDGASIANKGKNAQEKIIAKMRNPDQGMPKFAEKAISNKEAKVISGIYSASLQVNCKYS